jgi:hypothetical protein
VSGLPPKISCSYAIIDVQRGRKALAKYLQANAGLPVIIHATITDPFGSDDGVSIEFNMDVSKIEVKA